MRQAHTSRRWVRWRPSSGSFPEALHPAHIQGTAVIVLPTSLLFVNKNDGGDCSPPGYFSSMLLDAHPAVAGDCRSTPARPE